MLLNTADPIVIICGTNRPNSFSRQIATYYQDVLTNLDQSSLILDLTQLPVDFIATALYHNSGKNSQFNSLQEITARSGKFVFVVPEYNGSYPGVLKAFIDGLPYPNSFTNKKAALVGLSSNMQGASSALSHLSDIFSYLGMNTLALRVKLGQIKTHFQNGEFSNTFYRELIEIQARQLIAF